MNNRPFSAILPFYKHKGETPLQALHRLRIEQPELEKEKLSYAGRLDPMAEGLLLVLVGEANKERHKFLDLPKTYKVQILIGIETDTYDILGKVEKVSGNMSYSAHLLEESLGSFEGCIDLPYPPYSSKTVGGVPLFVLARSGKLDHALIPARAVNIYSIKTLASSIMKGDELLMYCEENIALVSGDFRQKEILEMWRRELEAKTDTSFPVITVEISCSSGTYMRSLAHKMGKRLGTGAMALSIIRTAIGDYSI